MEELNQLPFEKREEILQHAQKYGVTDVRIFGSVARGEATAQSDMDMLAVLPPEMGWHIGGFYMGLRRILNCDVDVISESFFQFKSRKDPNFSRIMLKDVIHLESLSVLPAAKTRSGAE